MVIVHVCGVFDRVNVSVIAIIYLDLFKRIFQFEYWTQPKIEFSGLKICLIAMMIISNVFIYKTGCKLF